MSSVARSTTTQSTTIKTTTTTTQKPTLVVRQLHPRAPKSYFIKPSNFFGQKVPPGGGKPQLHSNEIDIDNKVAEERHDHYYAKHPPRPHWKKPPPARYIPCVLSMIEPGARDPLEKQVSIRPNQCFSGLTVLTIP